MTEAILALADSDWSGDPQGAAQPSIAEFGKGSGRNIGLTVVSRGPARRYLETGDDERNGEDRRLGNDCQRIDRPDAGDLAKELIILAVPQQLIGLRLDLIALPDQAACLVNDHPCEWQAIKRQRQSNR